MTREGNAIVPQRVKQVTVIVENEDGSTTTFSGLRPGGGLEVEVVKPHQPWLADPYLIPPRAPDITRISFHVYDPLPADAWRVYQVRVVSALARQVERYARWRRANGPWSWSWGYDRSAWPRR